MRYVDNTGLTIWTAGYTSPMGNYGGPSPIYYSSLTGQRYDNRYDAAADEIAHIHDYLTISHIYNTDFNYRDVEAKGGHVPNHHCNEMAMNYFYQLGLKNVGAYSQNDTIATAVKGYQAAGLTINVPKVGTYGYCFYFNGKSWDHQEAFYVDDDGNMVVLHTEGSEVAVKQLIVGKVDKLTNADILAQTWGNKTKMLFVTLGKYDASLFGKDTTLFGKPDFFGLADYNKNHPDARNLGTGGIFSPGNDFSGTTITTVGFDIITAALNNLTDQMTNTDQSSNSGTGSDE